MFWPHERLVLFAGDFNFQLGYAMKNKHTVLKCNI